MTMDTSGERYGVPARQLLGGAGLNGDNEPEGP